MIFLDAMQSEYNCGKQCLVLSGQGYCGAIAVLSGRDCEEKPDYPSRRLRTSPPSVPNNSSILHPLMQFLLTVLLLHVYGSFFYIYSTDMIFVKIFTLPDFGPIIFYSKSITRNILHFGTKQRKIFGLIAEHICELQ